MQVAAEAMGVNEHRRMVLTMLDSSDDDDPEPHALVRVYGGIDHKAAKSLWVESFELLRVNPPEDQYMEAKLNTQTLLSIQFLWPAVGCRWRHRRP